MSGVIQYSRLKVAPVGCPEQCRLFEEDKKQVPDTGFKVFDSVPAPQLTVDETTLQIVKIDNDIDALSRIYNMIFTVGLDEPTQTPQQVVKDCIYNIGNHYYITNSHNISNDDCLSKKLFF